MASELEDNEERLGSMVDSDAYEQLQILRDDLQEKYDSMIRENQVLTKNIGIV